MGIDVAASGAFDGVSLEVFAQQQRLHFTEFERTKHAPQAGDAASVAASLRERLVDDFVAAVILPLQYNLLRVGVEFVAGHMRKIRMKAANQSLADVGMKLRFEQRKMCILAGKNPLFEDAFLQHFFDGLGHVLEVLTSFVLNAALGVAAIVAGISVAAAAARERMEEVVTLGQFSKAQIENAGSVAVNQNDAKQRRRA